MGQEPSLAHMGDQVEGVDALGRGDRVGSEDPKVVLGAVEKHLGDGQEPTGVLDRAGDGLLDMKRTSAVRGAGVLVRLPTDRARVIRNGENTA